MRIEDGPGDTLNAGESLDPAERNLTDDDVVDLLVTVAPDDALSEEIVDRVIEEEGPEVTRDIEDDLKRNLDLS